MIEIGLGVKEIQRRMSQNIKGIADRLATARDPQDIAAVSALLRAVSDDAQEFHKEWKEMVDEIKAQDRNEEAIVAGERRYRESVLGDEA
jgi:hypothetical protein